MSTLAIWCRVVQSRDASPHNFDGLAMSGLAFSVSHTQIHCMIIVISFCRMRNYHRLHISKVSDILVFFQDMYSRFVYIYSLYFRV